MSGAIIAADLGTTRIKLGVLTRQGGFRLVHAAAAPMSHDEPGAATQDPQRVIQACLEGLRRCADVAGDAEALVLTGQMGGAIVVDRGGDPLTPWITSMDTRCRAAARALRREVGARIRRLATGSPQQAERLRWLRESGRVPGGPGLALLLAPYVATRLAREGRGAAYCDRTCTVWSGLADVAAGRWDGELARAAQWSVDDLPPIVEPGSTVGHLSGAVAAATGLPADLPIVAGPGDQAASLYGLGCNAPGDIVDSASTFPVLSGVTEQYFVPRSARLEVMPGALPGTWHPLGYMLGSGAVPAWLAEGIAGSTLGELEREAEAEGSSAGILALPSGAYGGEVAGPGIFWGLHVSHRRGHLYRAILEGLAYEYALLIEELAAEGVAVRPPIVSLGGGAASPLLTRIKASVLGLPIRCLAAEEMTVAGAALLAARRGGWDVALDVSAGRLVQPQVADVQAYRDRLETYRRFRQEAVHVTDAVGLQPETGQP